MFQHATITERDRKMTFAFDGPMLEKEEHEIENWHERIKVTCTHNATKKRFEAHVSWCKAAERDGYTMEQSAIFTDPYLLLMASDPVARFNQNKFNVFCDAVQRECMSAVIDSHDTRPVIELLRKAQSYALVKN